MRFSIDIHHDETYELELIIGRDANRRSRIPVYVDKDAKNFAAYCECLKEDNEELFNVLVGFIGFTVASIVLSRLGDPLRTRKVGVQIEGILPKYAVGRIEDILRLFMISRTLPIRYPTKKAKVIISSELTTSRFRFGGDPSKALCSFSGGIDSTVCLKYLKEQGFSVDTVFFLYEIKNGHSLNELPFELESTRRILDVLRKRKVEVNHETIDANIIGLTDTPHLTKNSRMTAPSSQAYRYPEFRDIDFWEYYGRNAFTASLMLVIGYSKKSKYITLGHTKDCLGVTEREDLVLYDQCCQSIAFIKSFNEILARTFRREAPILYAPLINMSKSGIAKYLLSDLELFSLTRSCINPRKTECGFCFKCHDKITGLFSTCIPSQLQIEKEGSSFNIYYQRQRVAAFKWDCDGSIEEVPLFLCDDNTTRNIGRWALVWNDLLERYMQNYPQIPSDLLNSEYSYKSVISSLDNLEKEGKFSVFPIFGLYRKVKKKISEKKLKGLIEEYVNADLPIKPSIFLAKANELFRPRYTNLRDSDEGYSSDSAS